VNIRPKGVNLTDPLSCDNIGTETVQVDPRHPEQVYALFTCQGIWKSSDYGQTWNGPINKGTNGTTIGDCAGGITIARGDGDGPPTLYQSCIRGAATGFSRSVNGGVDWTQEQVNVEGSNNQFYPPAVDPNDPKHLVMAVHGPALMVESTDGGLTWQNVPLDPAMLPGGTGGVSFINMDDATKTRGTWLWTAQANGDVGTWRKEPGSPWTQVETNSHPGGVSQIYQPDNKGTVFMGGMYSKQGFGVFRSADYGKTWTHMGSDTLMERVVFGTKKTVYAMMGNEVQGTGSDPALQTAPQPGTSGWMLQPAPKEMMQGPLQAAVTNDGEHDIILLASWGSGLWRYVEP
jgi:hypothetical protein